MEKSHKNYDVLIIGAGPAGANAAISYKNLNPKLTVGLVDKAIFPRDKSCGDAIGPGVISALTVSYTHLRAHETVLDLVCRLVLE